MIKQFIIAFLLLVITLPVIGQDSLQNIEDINLKSDTPITGSIEFDYNLVQDDDDYLMPTIVMEVSGWHFEGRRNYEEKNSSSLWIGYNFEFGNVFKLNVIPLAGIVIGSVAGAAPGLELEMSYDILSLNIQSEYFYNAEDVDESFFYTWNEFTVTPIDWLYAGIVIERTKAYDASRDIQAGLFGGVTYKDFYITAYYFDPDKVDRSMLFALGWDF